MASWLTDTAAGCDRNHFSSLRLPISRELGADLDIDEAP
jgi:hypothetical protein